jgi:hypothetical protein
MVVISRLIFFSIFLFHFTFFISAQTDTSHLRISLLTCTPGEDLYSTFGHSALRVTDSMTSDDIVYNYGTFDFSEPNFYLKFVRGKLMYYLSTEEFNSFSEFYKAENRGITEQVLNLTASEKNKIKLLLQQNLLAENRFYKYDFLFDNCTTRLRDVIKQAADSTVTFRSVLARKETFRQLIYEYLDYNDKQWSKLGIDLFLGRKTDVVATTWQVMFLPDYLMKTFDNTTIGRRHLVATSTNLFPIAAVKKQIDYVAHPIFIFSLLFLAIVFLSFSKNNSIQRFLSRFDGFIFFIGGLTGILMLFMWFGTDHTMCKDNYNLLWAWPTHTIAAFYLLDNRKKNVAIYFKITAIVNTLVLLTWFLFPQHLNISLIPFVMLLIFRSLAAGFRKKEI